MMITVDRFASDDDSTLSLILVNGMFVAFGLEDEYRYKKVAGETRIPSGSYTIGLRRTGGFNARYSQRFGAQHRGMLEVRDVPGFSYVLIHVGNTDDDTAGCLLVGTGADSEAGDMRLTASVRAYLRLYNLVINAAVANDLQIEYFDGDAGRAPLLV